MYNIKILVLLMFSLQSISMYAMQESLHNVERGRQVMIDDAVTNFSYLTQGFDFLQTQGLIDTTFHDFLQQNISHDEHEDEEMNFDQVMIKAEDVLTLHMKHTFIKELDMTMKYYYSDDPVFLYVMEHKDTSMPDMVRLWLHEWSKTTNKGGFFPLDRAILNSNKIARMLIDAGVNVDIKNRYGQTPLHQAIFYSEIEIVQMLIDAGARLNLQDENGLTPLHLAVRNNSTKIVAMLIAAGANLSIRNKEGKTPLYSAISHNEKEIAHMLIHAGAHVNLKNNYGISLLHLAATHNNEEIVKMLLAASACINHQNKNGQTPLHLAVSNDNTNIALMLIHAGADTYILDKHGKTVDQLDGCTKIIIKSIVQNREKKQKKIDAQAIARLKKN
ncbi:ankyrin repeat domain-containing protein [Candidatus Chromulinivorax destructor]|uniref:Uncharacterized protein n=1 Tax=Candidatus Chromulinivorax destructor TaxID=2066483 RepID=A0A345ZA77_9BACT|nr:ankyrin repeat domain-containing protein [Candidatus Chromulinivorax destructor]AXK60194.1 hypothetical protein C0J27_00315 [Candidatus Chromulinivorax destructor]